MRRSILICLMFFSLFLIPNTSYGQNAEGLYAWGKNDEGQVGDGTNADRTYPRHVTHADIIAISGGERHSLALKSDGTVWAWGDNVYGQLGDETTIDSNMPVQVRGLKDVIAIAAGAYHSLALKKDNTVWAWGSNGSGELGDGTYENKNKPVQVLEDVKAVAAGYSHSLALKKNETVWAWGDNLHGQLGVNGEKIKNPVQVLTLKYVKAIAAGRNHSLAVAYDPESGSPNVVWAWGDNNYGQLGYGDDAGWSTPKPVTTTGSDDDTLNSIIKIDGGNYHSLALKDDGTVWAWGKNGSGQLGDGTISSPQERRTFPVKALNLENKKITQISAGAENSLALQDDGTIWAWGDNEYGQLGDDTNSPRLVPARVTRLTKGVLISSGTTHSLAVKLPSNEPECQQPQPLQSPKPPKSPIGKGNLQSLPGKLNKVLQ